MSAKILNKALKQPFVKILEQITYEQKRHKFLPENIIYRLGL